MLHSTEMLPVLRAQCRLLCANGFYAHRLMACAPRLVRGRAAHRSACAASTELADTAWPSATTGSQALPPMSWEGRDRGCGSLSEQDIGGSFTLCGWVHRQRNLGGEQVVICILLMACPAVPSLLSF